ncbi:MAG TPA: cytochrome P460 family protein [Acidobacteriota bacterium]|jgi:hypothetical protein
MLSRFRWYALTIIVTISAVSFTLIYSQNQDRDRAGPVFQGKETLLRPVGYREWVFVGSSLGLRYAPDPEAASKRPELYHNVYINPRSYREFVKTGKFPDGTMMVLELAGKESKHEPGLQGSFQKEYVALEASVKDSKRFPTGWAYFSFDSSDGKQKASAEPFSAEECFSCHDKKAATDHVFTQFYPVLRAARPAQP